MEGNGARTPELSLELPFLEGELLGTYAREQRSLGLQRITVACWLGLAILPLYGFADYSLYRDDFRILLGTRLVVLAVGLCAAVALRKARTKEWIYALAVALGIAFAIGASSVPVFLLGFSVPYYVGFIIIIFGMALLLPWPLRYAAGLSAAIVAAYVSASALHGIDGQWAAFVTHLSFVLASIAIALVSIHSGDQLRRREFQTRCALEAANRSKTQLIAQLGYKSAALQHVNREMEDLLYVASHDLRAPLINVQGFSREVQLGLDQLRAHTNGKSPETTAALNDIDESLQFILTGVTRMDALISSLLNVSRVGTRTHPVELVDLDTVVRKIAASFQYQLDERRITVDIAELPTVCGDPTRIGQLFGNLIDNAIKYMGNNGDRRIQIGSVVAEGERRLYVADSGPGIPADQQEHVFRLFRRLVNGGCPGEGIGLTLVRKIVEKHGGRIWIESQPGNGSTFWFTLPEKTSAVIAEDAYGRTQASDHPLG